MTRPIPPPPPPARDEPERELVRLLIAEAEAEGRLDRPFFVLRDALYAAWRTIDRLRAAQAGEEIAP